MGRPCCSYLNLLLASFIIVSSLPYPSEGQPGVATAEVRKEAAKVTSDGRILTRLTITNNGSVNIFAIKVYEYVNPAVQSERYVTLISNGRISNVSVFIQPSAATSSTQFIVENPPQQILKPKEKLIMEYWGKAEFPGDYYMPSSLVWFSYFYGASENTINIYSNGLIIHIPNAWEAGLRELLPYIISISVASVWIIVYMKSRRYL